MILTTHERTEAERLLLSEVAGRWLLGDQTTPRERAAVLAVVEQAAEAFGDEPDYVAELDEALLHDTFFAVLIGSEVEEFRRRVLLRRVRELATTSEALEQALDEVLEDVLVED